MSVEPVSTEIFIENHKRAHFKLARVDGKLPSRVELDFTQEALLQDHLQFLRETASELFNLNDPREILARGFESLGKVEARQFVIHNILESVKRGESLDGTLRRFNDLGLTDIQLPSHDSESMGSGRGEKTGRFLMRIMGFTKEFTHALYEIILNAIKAIPQFVAIRPSVGLVGVFPSLTFELECKAVTIDDLFCYLSGENPKQ